MDNNLNWLNKNGRNSKIVFFLDFITWNTHLTIATDNELERCDNLRGGGAVKCEIKEKFGVISSYELP